MQFGMPKGNAFSEPIELALLPILTTLIPVCLGPKGYVTIPCYVTKEHLRRPGPPYYTDIAVSKSEGATTSFVRVSHSVSSRHDYRNKDAGGQTNP